MGDLINKIKIIFYRFVTMKSSMLIYFFLFSFQTLFSQIKLDKEKISDAAISIIDPNVIYTSVYKKLDYPNGDVDSSTGVCTDVVIRSLRKLGIDLQKLIHEDMKNNFNKYPQFWGNSGPDKNIDHRRVYNQMRFFSRMGNEIEITDNSENYIPGDIVAWNLGGNISHIGVVVESKSLDGLRYMIIHNIGGGQVLEDILFNYKIIGHYRFNYNPEI